MPPSLHTPLRSSPVSPLRPEDRVLESIDMEGGLHICTGCGSTIAKLLGWVKPDKAKALADENAELRAETTRLTNLLTAAEALQAAIDKFNEVSAA